MANSILRYFNLNDPGRQVLREPARAAVAAGAWPQWLALICGIFIQPYLSHYRETREWNFAGSEGWLLFSILVGIAVFPSVYRAAFDSKKPWLVLIAPSFTAGLGWEAIFGTILKSAGH